MLELFSSLFFCYTITTGRWFNNSRWGTLRPFQRQGLDAWRPWSRSWLMEFGSATLWSLGYRNYSSCIGFGKKARYTPLKFNCSPRPEKFVAWWAAIRLPIGKVNSHFLLGRFRGKVLYWKDRYWKDFFIDVCCWVNSLWVVRAWK